MKPRVFIGSSSEAVDRGIVEKLVEELADSTDPVDWSDVFDVNDVTIEAIIDEALISDFAIFVFAKDDDGITRGKSTIFTRDNVVLEAGLFIGKLGRSRVFIMIEENVKVPSDLFGINLSKFPPIEGNTSVFSNKIKSELRKIKKQIKRLGKKDRSFPEKDRSFPEWELPNINLFGLDPVLKTEYMHIREKYEGVRKFSLNQAFSTKEPLNFYSNLFCIDAYVGGLSNVQNSYLTTTSLDSAFWTQRNAAAVMAANEKMMNRIRKNGGEIVRLFLLDKPLEMHTQLLADKVISLRRKERKEEIEKLQIDFRQLKRSIERQINDGCQVMLVHDSSLEYRALPKEVSFERGSTEIAIYDDFRVDFFKSGSYGEIIEVKSYTDVTKNFSIYLSQATNYFKNLCENGIDISDALDRIENAISLAVNKIDYKPYWLSYYEQDLDKQDRKLKFLEKARVEEEINKNKKWGKINNFLDVGTCTGRYLIELREAIAATGNIVGIDDDQDCVDFTNNKVTNLDYEDSRISVLRCDFLSEMKDPNIYQKAPYDLITCMLGTISHFNTASLSTKKENLKFSIYRFKELLSKEGSLFIGSWSNTAVEREAFLSIYSDLDMKQLAKWTPTKDQLMSLFYETGLTIKYNAVIDDRIDFFHLSKN